MHAVGREREWERDGARDGGRAYAVLDEDLHPEYLLWIQNATTLDGAVILGQAPLSSLAVWAQDVRPDFELWFEQGARYSGGWLRSFSAALRHSGDMGPDRLGVCGGKQTFVWVVVVAEAAAAVCVGVALWRSPPRTARW